MPDLVEDVAALLHPMPIPSVHPNDAEQEVIDSQREQVIRDREDSAARLRRMWNETDMDPLLHALDEQRRIRAAAEARIRHLVAYAREFVSPRPYTLEALAPSLGSSASAVRGGYDHRDVEQVAAITGRRSIVPQTPADTAAAARLVDELAARAVCDQVREQMPGVAAALLERGWTPYAPLRRTANPKFAKQYVRWEKRWPNGTVISLYQEPTGWLGTYTRMPEDDPRWFGEQYGIIDPDDGKPITASDISDALVIYDGRVTRYDAEAAAR